MFKVLRPAQGRCVLIKVLGLWVGAAAEKELHDAGVPFRGCHVE
jgi:hypothetical protein